MKSTAVKNEQHWHDLRAQNIGGSEVAALFNESSYLTYFELWHRKAGNIPEPDLSGSDRIFWGQTLEPSIALGVAKLKGWSIRNVKRYLASDRIAGFGGSLDFEIVNNKRGPGVLEIKNVDYLIWRDWENDEPPLGHLLQLQAYLALTKRSWGAVAVLVGGNDIKVYEYEARPKIIEAIENKITEFWQSIKDGKEPKPVFDQDYATIQALYGAVGIETVDMTGDNYLASLCAEYKSAANDEKIAKGKKSAAMGEILTKIDDAKKVLLDGFRISSTVIPETQVTFTRKESRRTTIFEIKEKE